MDTFDRTTLLRLADYHNGPCTSIYLTTHPSGPDAEQDAIRLDNLLNHAERELSDKWLRAPDARDLLSTTRVLPHDVEFWKHRSRGLAVFISAARSEVFRLPIAISENVQVAHRFRLRPVLPMLNELYAFYLLTLSENRVALFMIDEHGMEPLTVPDLPRCLVDELNYSGADRGSQVHSAARGISGKQGAVFHGQGGVADTAKSDLSLYCAAIDRAVTRFLEGSRLPLLLACVEPLAAIYRTNNSYPQLLDTTLLGNFEYTSEHDLHHAATSLVRPILLRETDRICERYANRSGSDRVAHDPRDVVLAALQGRIESLLYDARAELYGKVDEPGAQVTVTNDEADDDLIERAAIETLRHRGTLHLLTNQTIPTNTPMSAVLRY